MRETGREPIRFKVFENLTFEESNVIENQMIMSIGRLDSCKGPLTNKTNGGEDGKLQKNKNVKFYGVSIVRKRGKETFQAGVTKKHKIFKTEIEAAEAVDKINLYLYGEDFVINFPEKIPQYREINLEDFYNYFTTSLIDEKRRTKYKWVIPSFFKDSIKWKVRINRQYIKTPRFLKLDCFETEEEAAKMADKVVFFYNNVEKDKLNFPDLYNTFNREELSSFFNSCIKPNSSQYQGISLRGRGTKYEGWQVQFKYKKTLIIIGSYYKTEKIAYESQQAYLNEFYNENPSLERLKNYKISEKALEFLTARNCRNL